MHLKYFLCCLPLKYGVMFVGFAYGTSYFIIGTTGLEMVMDAKYNESLVWFFRKMSIKACVTVGSLIFYFMAIINFLLAYAAYAGNHLIVGIWLLVHFTMFMLTLYSALVHTYFLFHIVSVGYAIFVVKSFYETLTPSSDYESDDDESSEEEV